MDDKAAICKLLQDAIEQFTTVLKSIETISGNFVDVDTDEDEEKGTTPAECQAIENALAVDQCGSNSRASKDVGNKQTKPKIEKILKEIDEICDKSTLNLKEYTTQIRERRQKTVKDATENCARSRRRRKIVCDGSDDDSRSSSGCVEQPEQLHVDKQPAENETDVLQSEEKIGDSKPSILKLVPIEQLLSPTVVLRAKPSMQTIVLDTDDDDDDDDDAVVLTTPNNRPSTPTTLTTTIPCSEPKTDNGSIPKTKPCKRITVAMKRLPKDLDTLLKRYGLTDVDNSKFLTVHCPSTAAAASSSSSSLSLNRKKHDSRESLRIKITKPIKETRTSQRTTRATRYIESDDSTSSSASASSSTSSAGDDFDRKTTVKKLVGTHLTNGDSKRKTTNTGNRDGSSCDEAKKSSESVATTSKKKSSNKKEKHRNKEDNGEMSSGAESSTSAIKRKLRKSKDAPDRSKLDSMENNADACDGKSNTKSSEIDENSDGEKDATMNSDNDSDMDKDLSKQTEKNASSTKDDSNNDDDDDDVEKKKKKKKQQQQAANSDDSDDFQITKKKIVKRKTRTTTENDSSGESDRSQKKKRKRRRIKKGGDSSSDDDNDKSPTKGRKNIKKIIKTKDLEDETKQATREESERKKRIEERQKLYNQYYDIEPEEVTELDKLILDFDEKTKDELISVDRKLVKKLKPHQGSGVKFMWDACFETLSRIENSPGSGCILAHCMGLGKTLQVITLVHTLMTHSDATNVEKVLVICPLSTVLNWVNEFKIWLRCCAHRRDIEIFEISKYKQNSERVFHINEWHEEGGVLIMGYDMFRNLSSGAGKGRLSKKSKDSLQKSLIDPGPDLVICDEGHLLKNSKTSLSKAVNRIRTLRRIVLTGTPLQNNLNEYYCMVQFVKPNLLGKYNEYLNRFVNPITNGQYVDSTPRDISMMKKRSHILHKLLDGCVQRRDYSVLAPYLPVKQEFVVFIKLTKLQVNLYQYYMSSKPARVENSKPGRTSVLFADFQNLQRIWTHPRVLRYNSDKYEINAQKKRDLMSENESEGSIKDFIDDGSSDDTPNSSSSNDSSSEGSDNGSHKSTTKTKKPKTEQPTKGTRRTRATAGDQPCIELADVQQKEENPTEWWMSLCPEEELDNLTHSGKLMLLFSLLEECEQIGDKLLVFSQSLYSLDVIEHFLARIDDYTQTKKEDDDDTSEQGKMLGGYTGSWSLGIDYFRLDGSTSIEQRNNACNLFNKESNTRARLFLISTRAGGLGINLVAANRVVIFDVSWNPSHDIQSIFRVYRFGQNKPCYIYRFIAMGSMEEKIYERQVTKLAISKRVIDEHQIDRHYKEHDLMELYKMDLEPTEARPTPILPKDRMFAGQLKKFDHLIFKYHEHDSLLENKEGETLNEDEIKAAWEEFEAEKTQVQINYTHQPRATGMGPVTSNTIFGFRSDVLLKLLNLYARQMYPSVDEHQLKQLVPLLLQQLYEKMRNGDTSMYNTLLILQQKLEAPSYHVAPNTAGMLLNPFSLMANQPNQIQMQQQQLIAQVQNRFIQNVRPQQTGAPNSIIELE